MPSHPERVRRNQPEVNEPIPIVHVSLPKPRVPTAEERAVGISIWYRHGYTTPDRRACPRCQGPSLSGGICLACLRGPDEPTTDTPWAV